MPHIHEEYDFTVSAHIVHDNKLLLLHHKKLNTWMQPGGHVELSEDPEQALWHEILEETGIEKRDLKIIEPTKSRPAPASYISLPLPFDFNVHKYGEDPTHKHIDLCYLLTSKTDQIKTNLDESNDLRWFTKAEIVAMKADMINDVYARALYVLNLAL